MLHLATRKPSRKCLPLVLKFYNIGKDQINLTDKNKRTALHWAASIGASSYVALLLKNGAKPDAPDVEGKIPLHWACSFDESAVANNEVEKTQRSASNSRNLDLYISRTPRTIQESASSY